MAEHVAALLDGLGLSQYLACFEEEEMTDVALLRDIGARPEALRSILKELGVAKIGHRERLVNAVLQLPPTRRLEAGAPEAEAAAGAPAQSAEELATRQALGLSRGIVAGGLSLTAAAQRPAWQETAPPDDEEEADALGRLDLALGSAIAASLASSLGAIGAREEKVQCLLRHGWVPRVIATLPAALAAATAELTEAEAERAAAEAERAAERAAAEAEARAAASAADDARAEEEQAAAAAASIDDVDDFELAQAGTDPSAAALAPAAQAAPPSTSILLEEAGAGAGEGAERRRWRVAAARHWSLAELRAAAAAPDLLGAAPFRFCSPDGIPPGPLVGSFCKALIVVGWQAALAS